MRKSVRKTYGRLQRQDHRLEIGPAGRNLFVSREKQLEQRKAAQLRRWMRLLLTAAVLLAVLAAAIISLTYMAPWLVTEITQRGASAAPEESAAPPAAPVYDELGLQVFPREVGLYVVNAQHPAGEEDVPELVTVSGVEVDARIAPALRMLIAAAKDDGYFLRLTEGYVSYAEQEERFQQAVERLVKEKKLTAVMARKEAAALQPRPGESDFQSGMCVRLSGDPETFAVSRTYSWLKNNMGKYGFVFRFPEHTESATGVAADPTVIRYVGAENAQAMQQRGLCLEEYLDYLDSQ